MGLWSNWIWPLLTAILGFVYTGLLFAQWLKRRKMHQLMWTIGFLFYAVAAVMEFWSEYTQHWDPTVYCVYIVLAASLVGFLGNGTLYLITKKRLSGDVYLGFNLVMLAIFFYGTFHATLLMDKLVPGIVVGGQALGASGTFPRLMSLVFNIPGSLILLGGSAWSIIKFWPNKAYRYRVWANVLIIIGTLMIAGAGSMARLGNTGGLYVGEMIASAILLAGFLMAGTLEKGAQAARAAHAAGTVPTAGATNVAVQVNVTVEHAPGEAPSSDVAPVEPVVPEPPAPPRMPGDERGVGGPG